MKARGERALTRSARTAACTVLRAAVALAAALSACGGAGNDWPNDVLLTSAHFRYHARHGDVLCDDLLAQLEHNLTVVSRVLGFDPAAVSIDYYKYRDKADLLATGPCPDGWTACAGGSTIHTAVRAHQHELIHGYVWHVGNPSNVYQEGLAEMFNCTAQAGPTPPPAVSVTDVVMHASSRSATSSIGERAYYSAAMFFVRYLIDQFGAQRFMQFYGGESSHESTVEQFRAEFEAAFGVDLEDAWAQAFSPSTAFGWPFLCPCDDPVSTQSPIDFSVTCGTGVMPTIPFVVDATTTLALTVAGADSAIVVRSCDGIAASPALEMSTADFIDPSRRRSGIALVTELPAGKYYVGVIHGSGTLAVKNVPWLGLQCGDSQSIRLGTDFPNDYTLWISSPPGPERWLGLDTTEPLTQYSNEVPHYCSSCPDGALLEACLWPSSTAEVVPAGSYLLPVEASTGPRFHSISLQFTAAP